jgi:hypothetical protein
VSGDLPVVVLWSGGAHYVGIGRAAEVVRWLGERGYGVIGMEGFSCDGSTVRPSPAHIADLSHVLETGAAERAAAAGLAKWKGSVEWIDLELLRRPE